MTNDEKKKLIGIVKYAFTDFQTIPDEVSSHKELHEVLIQVRELAGSFVQGDEISGGDCKRLAGQLNKFEEKINDVLQNTWFHAAKSLLRSVDFAAAGNGPIASTHAEAVVKILAKNNRPKCNNSNNT